MSAQGGGGDTGNDRGLRTHLVGQWLQLAVWFWQRGRFDLDKRYAGLILHTLYLGSMAALITVSVALVLAFARRSTSLWCQTWSVAA